MPASYKIDNEQRSERGNERRAVICTGSGVPAKALRMLLVLLAGAFCLAACSVRAAAPSGSQMNWTVDGVQRVALVYPPSQKDASGKVPVILAFHGHGGDMNDAHAGMHFETYWPEAVIVYLQGLPTNPAADPEGYGWIYNTEKDGQRDVKFVDAVLATLHSKFAVDDNRIYATGFSNGGMFTYVLWGARTNIFAAFAVVSGRVSAGVHLSVPKPVLVVGGQRDRTVMFKDQLAAIETARQVDDANGTGTSCGGECLAYASSKGAPVVTYIHDGGHVYPPGAPYLTVKFFKDHPLVK
jgi:polyhydroxybutyrate depolymerase